MIKIEVDGRFLDLPVDARMQSERNTPLLLGDEILGEYTYPLLLPVTENNCRILGFINELGAVKTAKEVRKPAQLYEWDVLTARGTLVAEYVSIDLNNPEAGNISAFLLMSISSFYSQADRVLLRNLNLGGDRKIREFTKHAMSTWYGDSDTFDYVFAPVANKAFNTEDEDMGDYDGKKEPTSYFMNGVTYDIDPAGAAGLQFCNFRYSRTRRVPFLYLKYLLIKCFEHFGYTISGELLNDPDFKKAFLLNYQSVYWGYISKRAPTGWRMIELPEVELNLTNHVPRDYSVTRFLIAFANFWGITYVFDPLRKHCSLFPLNKITQTGRRKDLTACVDPVIKVEFEKEAKVYALKIEFDGGDSTINKLDLKQYRRLKDVDVITQAPQATELNDTHIILARKINWFYQCKPGDDGEYRWEYLCDNIYDYAPAGSNAEITTAMGPVGTTHHDWFYLSEDNYRKALFPVVAQEGNWPGKRTAFANWGLRVLFYHGMQPDDSAIPGFYYPFASSHNFNSMGQKVSNYSLCFNAEDGIVNRFWKNWLDTLSAFEVVNLSCNLTFAEYLNLSWTDLLLIRNVLYLNIQHSPTVPFTGTLPVKAIRIVNAKSVALPCTAAITLITVSYTDGDYAMVDFVEQPAGSNAWQYTIDDEYTDTVYSHPFRIRVSPGAHNITITPMCGEIPNEAGAAALKFIIPEPVVRITLSADLTTGRDPHNKMVLTARFSVPPNVPAEAWRFNFGQCVVNTTIPGSHICRGFDGAEGSYGTLYSRPLVAWVSAESGSDTPGANFGYITKVVIWGIYSPKYKLQFEKAPGQNWELVVNP